MTQIGEAFVRVRPDTRGFERDTERQVGGAVRGASSTLKRTAGSLLAAGGIVGGVALIGQAVRGAAAEFSEASKVAAQTNAVLESTQGVANVTAREVDDLSVSLMRLTGVDDEVIKQGENILLTFTKVRDEVGAGNDVFSQATELALDLSVALRTSMSGAALQLGKALNDPVRGMNALRRAGVSFTKEQQDQVKAMVKAGDLLGAQKMILAELRTEFGGTARAIGQTLPGQISLLKNQIDELGGTVAANLAPELEKVVRRANEWISVSENQKRVTDTVTDAVETGAQIVRGFADAIELVGTVTKPVIDALGGLENAAQLALLVGIGLKVKKAAASFGLIAAAFSLTTRKVVADSVVMGRAIDVATRPRTVVVTTTTTGTFTPAGKGGKPLPGKGGKVPPIGFTPATIAGAVTVGALNVAGGSSAQLQGFGEPVGRTPDGAFIYRRNNELWVVGKGSGSRTARGAFGQPVTLVPYRPTGIPGRRPEEGTRGVPGGAPPKRTATAAKAAGAKAAARPLTIEQVTERLTGFEERRVDAELRGSEAAQAKVLRAEAAFLTRAIKTAAVSVDERIKLKRELLSVQDELRRITEGTAKETTAATTSRVSKTTEAIDARLAAFAERRLDAELRGGTGVRVLREEEAFIRAQIKRYAGNVEVRRKLKAELGRVLKEIADETDTTTTAGRVSITAGIDKQLAAFAERRTDAELVGDTTDRVLREEEAFIRAQIRRYQSNVEIRRKLKDELRRVLDELDSESRSTSRTVVSGSTRAAQRQGSLFRLLRADDRERRAQAAREGVTLGEVVAREERPTTATTARIVSGGGRRGTATTVEAGEVPSLDGLLREIANGQARRDAMQLAATQETNRLLRSLTAGQPTRPAPPRAPTVQPDDVPSVAGSRARMRGL